MVELLERDELLARLGGHESEGGRLVFVGGEAGVGKTALIRAFAAGKPALRGSCENLTTPTPFGPFLDLGIDVDADPRRVARAVLEALENVPLLILEDLHWADQATLDALRVLGRRVDSTQALVVATYRDDEVGSGHPLRVVLGELASTPAVTRLSVPRLSLDAVRELAGPYGADAEAIHRLTDGNAFYVTEVLAAGSELLPATVRDAVLARAAHLEPTARRLLEAVSVVPGRVELALLEAIASAELDALGSCLEAGVLREAGDGVAFRHELARLAVESAIPPDRRRTFHAEIVRALVPSGDFSRLAHHAEEAGDSASVLEFAPEAGRRAAAASAHREAAAQYARALRHGNRLSPSERAALLVAYGRETELIGQFEASIDARLDAIRLYRELGDRLGEGATLSHLTIPYIRVGRTADGEAASREAIAILETLPPGPDLATAYAEQAYARMLCRDNAEGAAWGAKAVAAAEALGDHDILAFGLNMVGTSTMMAGRIDEGVDDLLRSLEIARTDELELRVQLALMNLGSGLAEMYELDRAERYLRECIEFAEARELPFLYARSWLTLVEIYTGRWTDGGAHASELLQQQTDQITRISSAIALGRVRARRGDPGAAEVLDEALEIAQPGGHLQRLGHVHAARAEAAWIAGDEERTVEEARAVYPLALEKRHLWFAGELAYWQWKAGVLDSAPEWIAEPYRLQLARDAEGAAAAWRGRGCPYEAARALAESADESLLLEALAEFERLGAAPAAKAVRRELLARGAAVPRGPRRATRANPAELTARELDVLRLVAAGKRNADVAAELVLSPRTVDHHVSAILRKLQVRTRGEAAAAANELGLLQDG